MGWREKIDDEGAKELEFPNKWLKVGSTNYQQDCCTLAAFYNFSRHPPLHFAQANSIKRRNNRFADDKRNVNGQ
jgi:hypothetical protein